MLLSDSFCSGVPFDPVPVLNNAVANIICQIVFGRRFDYTDHTFQRLLQHLTEMAYLEGSIWALVRHSVCVMFDTQKVVQNIADSSRFLQTAV